MRTLFEQFNVQLPECVVICDYNHTAWHKHTSTQARKHHAHAENNK